VKLKWTGSIPAIYIYGLRIKIPKQELADSGIIEVRVLDKTF